MTSASLQAPRNIALAPGMQRTEISRGLYPRAPELRRKSALTPAEQFWVVKHGLKMTGMPAWGVTHDDELLWDVVAFLQKLPELDADQYQALVRRPLMGAALKSATADPPREFRRESFITSILVYSAFAELLVVAIS